MPVSITTSQIVLQVSDNGTPSNYYFTTPTSAGATNTGLNLSATNSISSSSSITPSQWVTCTTGDAPVAGVFTVDANSNYYFNNYLLQQQQTNSYGNIPTYTVNSWTGNQPNPTAGPVISTNTFMSSYCPVFADNTYANVCDAINTSGNKMTKCNYSTS